MRVGRLPSPTGDLRADAVAELRWARRGDGLTIDKLAYMPAVLQLPVIRDAVAGLPAAARLVTAYDAVVTAAADQGDSPQAQMLRAALGIGDASGKNLVGRRRQFKSVNEPRTIYDIENRMIDALVTALGGIPGAKADDGLGRDAPAVRPLAWNVPLLRDPHFVGRDELLEQIRLALRGDVATALTHTVTQTLSGLGGIGKTALATEFAYRHLADYDVVWWLRGEEPVTLAADFAALGVALDLPVPGGSQADAITSVRTWLTGHDRWLLIFDNAEGPEDIEAYLPGLRGHVLVTSRNPHWPTIAAVVDVPGLDVDSAAELICRRTSIDDRESATTLAMKLDSIPKLIDIAAGLFNRGDGVSLARFASRLGDGTAATRGVWDAAFTKALTVDGTRKVLAACTVLNPDDIPVDLLTMALGLPGDTAETAIGALRAQQILRRTVNGLTIHRRVQAAARERLATADQRQAAETITELLLGIDTNPHPAQRPFARRARTAVPYLVAVLGKDTQAGRLLHWYAVHLTADGAFGAARDAAERALAIFEVSLGPDHPDVGWCYSSLAEILGELGEPAAARDAAEHALNIIETTLAPDHPDIGRLLAVLAATLRDLGKLPAARDAAERALSILEIALGPDHPEIGRRLGTLAVILHDLGDLTAALDAAERAVSILETTLGPDHPAIGWRLGILARILRDLGDLAAAIDAAERAVSILETTLGPDHPSVGMRLGTLAGALRDSGELTAARDAAERGAKILEAALGPDHRDVGWRLGTLAGILRDLGELTAARETAGRALTVLETALGPDHPDVRRTRQLLSTLQTET